MTKLKRQWAEFIVWLLRGTHSLPSLWTKFIAHQMGKDSTVNSWFSMLMKELAWVIQEQHIMGKAFLFGSEMHHTIHCFGSKFIFLMVYFLSNIKISELYCMLTGYLRWEVRGELEAWSMVWRSKTQGSWAVRRQNRRSPSTSRHSR